MGNSETYFLYMASTLHQSTSYHYYPCTLKSPKAHAHAGLLDALQHSILRVALSIGGVGIGGRVREAWGGNMKPRSSWGVRKSGVPWGRIPRGSITIL